MALSLVAFLPLAALAAAVPSGTPLSLTKCSSTSTSQKFTLQASGAVSTQDGTSCITYVSPSPTALQMFPCMPSSWNQTFTFTSSTFRITPPGSSCVAFNSQNNVMSTWTCDSIAWNGMFGPNVPFQGAISQNFTENGGSTFSDLCITFAPLPPSPSPRPSPPPCSPSSCTSALDCNLNGECGTDRKCTCYKPWGGSTCGELQFLPIAPPAEKNGYPGLSPNETTWGGNAILFNGEWHLFVAEMINNCTLAQWGSNSQCAHAVSATPEGPYTKVDVAVGVWCHNVRGIIRHAARVPAFLLSSGFRLL